MGLFAFDKLQKLWSFWDLRAFVLLSLFLQFFLVFASPLRKKTANVIITSLIWLAYLSADWAATFAVGIMSHDHGDTSVDQRTSDLTAFWAPFLINHLGGPDTITAFSLEDNELWLRHLLQLVSQLAATGYVFYKSLPTNELLAPTILMFIAGVIKYVERTNALYHASVTKFRNSLMKPRDAGPNYAKLMDESAMLDDERMPFSIKVTKEPQLEFRFKRQVDVSPETNDREMVQDAFMFFNMFKGQVADLVFRKHEERKSREYFINRHPEQAFKVVELELNFFYDVLYTKTAVIHSKVGYLLRLVSFVLVFSTFSLWYTMDKSRFDGQDVKITHTLLSGAIALDVIAFFMVILSEWTMARVTFIRQIRRNLVYTFRAVLDKKWVSRMFCRRRPKDRRTIPYPVIALRTFSRRWSETIQQYDLIESCLNLRNQKVDSLYERLGLKDLLDGNKYVFQKPFEASLRNSIFWELTEKAQMVNNPTKAESIFKARGEWALQHVLRDTSDVCKLKTLETWITKVEYDESLLIWHIATQLCYSCGIQVLMEDATSEDTDQLTSDAHDEPEDDLPYEEEDVEQQNNGTHDESPTRVGWPHDESEDTDQLPSDAHDGIAAIEQLDYRRMSKTLSNYMLYLLLRQPKMMIGVSGIGQLRFRDTTAEAEKFFDSLDLDPMSEIRENKATACRELLAVDAYIPTKEAKGERSKSVLFEGCRLAKELMSLEENKWKVIHKVWVEMLSYAASHCSGNAHAAELSKGGQLITFVWLLMVHLGLKKQFLINEDDVGAKLVVGE